MGTLSEPQHRFRLGESFFFCEINGFLVSCVVPFAPLNSCSLAFDSAACALLTLVRQSGHATFFSSVLLQRAPA